MFLYLAHGFLGIPFVALPYILLFLLCVSELSDAFDGYFARKFDQVTDFGKLLDPMADSIYRISVFFTFTQPPVRLPLLLVFVFLYRDSVISTLRTICALKGFALAARSTGKIKAVLQAASMILIVVLLIPYSVGMLSEYALRVTSIVVVSISAAYALYAGVEYVWANREYVIRLLVKKAKD
ncbi:MAG: CDP-diacylglycerol--glycerol-3-phosphate 3-phosphatidyltransferase [Chlamydiales bacterium]|nr:CDP-diacylglycerol--glycerol-3-phosphate 3-phosphatidyltransferase [Chlamydiales bacterium]MCH9619913.1 CDP-diacylglycerol--glycerol-3-phosphate 3-phosphatidyltransferase [Chlamydiales bacterium]MCH9622660.1 CDP-diacylglycerol--glycerol-3-phosphate 3-phosphatidyltransferase [Chlamydiales bacterium]